MQTRQCTDTVPPSQHVPAAWLEALPHQIPAITAMLDRTLVHADLQQCIHLMALLAQRLVSLLYVGVQHSCKALHERCSMLAGQDCMTTV